MCDFSKVPPNLPAPVDHGECDHLVGSSLPDVFLVDSASGKQVRMSALSGVCVLFLYPMTGRVSRFRTRYCRMPSSILRRRFRFPHFP